ncbi:MAG: hypothetical protein Q9180_004195, partial [Flavoplaca navasiana]
SHTPMSPDRRNRSEYESDSSASLHDLPSPKRSRRAEPERLERLQPLPPVAVSGMLHWTRNITADKVGQRLGSVFGSESRSSSSARGGTRGGSSQTSYRPSSVNPSDSPSNPQQDRPNYGFIWEGCARKNKKKRDGTHEWPMLSVEHDDLIKVVKERVLAHAFSCAEDGDVGPDAALLEGSTERAPRKRLINQNIANHEAAMLYGCFSTFRSQGINRVRAITQVAFEWPPDEAKRLAYIRDLLDNEMFLKADKTERKGLFLDPILTKCIGRLFFSLGGRGWAMARQEPTMAYFNPLCEGTVAYVATLLKHAIEERKGPIGVNQKMEGLTYTDVPFKHYLKCWDNIPEHLHTDVATTIGNRAAEFGGLSGLPATTTKGPTPKVYQFRPGDYDGLLDKTTENGSDMDDPERQDGNHADVGDGRANGNDIDRRSLDEENASNECLDFRSATDRDRATGRVRESNDERAVGNSDLSDPPQSPSTHRSRNTAPDPLASRDDDLEEEASIQVKWFPKTEGRAKKMRVYLHVDFPGLLQFLGLTKGKSKRKPQVWWWNESTKDGGPWATNAAYDEWKSRLLPNSCIMMSDYDRFRNNE